MEQTEVYAIESKLNGILLCTYNAFGIEFTKEISIILMELNLELL